MTLIYVAGAFTAKTKKQVRANIALARKAAEELWLEGFAVICPHLNCPEGFEKTIGYEQLLAGDLEMIKRCDAVYFLKNWEKSSGARREHQFVLDNGITRRYQ